ncbi:MAG: hypothetical protein AAF547_00430 [Actinomycetota bacterium]
MRCSRRVDWGSCAVALLAALIAVLATACIGDDADAEADQSSDTAGSVAATTTVATTATTVAAEPEPDDQAGAGGATVEARFVLDGVLPLTTSEVNDMMAFIEAEAGREFRYPPTIVAQDRATYEQGLADRFGDQVDGMVEDGEESARFYQALGLSEQTPDELSANLQAFITSADAINGYYDPETDAVYIPGDVTIDGAFRSLVVHELLHALDGQYIDLGALIDELETSDDTESGFVTTAIIEGRATAVQNAWMMANGVVPELGEVPETVAAVPPAFVNALTLPYGVGQAYIVSTGGAAETWDDYEEQPASSEHVLFPDTPADEAIIEVPVPAADGDVLSEGSFGAADLVVWLAGDSLQPSPAAVTAALTAADGWAGGSSVLWGDDTESCIRMALAADTPADLDELRAPIDAWADRADGRTVETAGDQLLVTGCAPFRS